jgi:hypothetical protein
VRKASQNTPETREQIKTGTPVSKNQLTVDHLRIACRHVQELVDAGVTENLAIRTLELFTDVYAKLLNGGSATPHHVLQIPREQWSEAARELWHKSPRLKPRDYLRVEHGTPRRAFARMVLELYRTNDFSEPSLARLVKTYWKLAVITLDEDSRLNQLARSKPFSSPDERWQHANISFATERCRGLGRGE